MAIEQGIIEKVINIIFQKINNDFQKIDRRLTNIKKITRYMQILQTISDEVFEKRPVLQKNNQASFNNPAHLSVLLFLMKLWIFGESDSFGKLEMILQYNKREHTIKHQNSEKNIDKMLVSIK